MEGSLRLGRVLVAAQGALARRLIAFYRRERLETVAAFSDADAEASWVEQADYDVYLGPGGIGPTGPDPARVVSAAMDAGCEALHPGCGPLASRVDLVSVATSANLVVLGLDAGRAAELLDQARVLGRARKLGLPVLPGSEPLGPQDDGIAAAARLGLPLWIRPTHEGPGVRVARFDALPEALAEARVRALAFTGEPGVFLQVDPVGARRVTTVLVADRRGGCIDLGEIDADPAAPVEMGRSLWSDALRQRLGEQAVRLARECGLVGVGGVHWAVDAEGRAHLLGLSSRLPAAWALVEAVQGVDLIEAQHLAFLGRPLGWEQRDASELSTHGVAVELRVEGAPGALEALSLPAVAEGLRVEVDAEPGRACAAGDPLATLVAVGPDRPAARERLRGALDRVEVRGVGSNLGALRAALAGPAT